MSKAFTKESDLEAEDPVSLPRSALPPGVTNYITPTGAKRLQEELARLTDSKRESAETANNLAASPNPDARKLEVRIRQLREILGSVVVAQPPSDSQGKIRFGAKVSVRRASQEQTSYQIVGVDESDPDAGRISWLSPLARQLLNRKVGESIQFQSPSGVETLQIVSVNYG